MKKLIGSILCAIMVIGMATPAFADWAISPDWPGCSNIYVNIYGNQGAAMSGRKLNLYKTTATGIDQKFTVKYSTYGTKKCMYLTRTQSGVVYAINRASYAAASGKAAIMWKLSDGLKDSAFKMPTPNPDTIFGMLNYSAGLAYDVNKTYSGGPVWIGSGGPWFVGGTPAL